MLMHHQIHIRRRTAFLPPPLPSDSDIDAQLAHFAAILSADDQDPFFAL